MFELYFTLFQLLYSPIEGDRAIASRNEYRQYQSHAMTMVSYVNYALIYGILSFLHDLDYSSTVSYVN